MADIAIIFPGFITLDRMDSMFAEELMRWHDKAIKRSESSS